MSVRWITLIVQRILLFSGLLLVLACVTGCSIRYANNQGNESILSFPPGSTTMTVVTVPGEHARWMHLKRRGVGLDLSPRGFGFLLGYEELFLLELGGDGVWEANYDGGEMTLVKKSWAEVSPVPQTGSVEFSEP